MRGLALIAIAGVAAAQPSLTEAMGEASYPLLADQVEVILSLSNQERSAAAAADRNSNNARAALDAARRITGSTGSVRLHSYSISYTQPQTAGASRSFTVIAEIRATVPDLATANRVADAAREAGGARIETITEWQRDSRFSRENALRQAALAARRNLDALADAAGTRVERFASVSAELISDTYVLDLGNVLPIERVPIVSIGLSTYREPSAAQVRLRTALSSAGNSPRATLTAPGFATVPFEPDQADVRLSIVQQGSTSQAATNSILATSRDVQAVLRRLAGPGGEVSASRIQLQTFEPNVGFREPGGVRASQDFRVLASDLANAARLIDAAFAAGVTQVNLVRLGLRDEDAVRQEAQRRAVQQARANAAAIAAALNVRLGAVLSVKPNSSSRVIDVTVPVATGRVTNVLELSVGVAVEMELLQ